DPPVKIGMGSGDATRPPKTGWFIRLLRSRERASSMPRFPVAGRPRLRLQVGQNLAAGVALHLPDDAVHQPREVFTEALDLLPDLLGLVGEFFLRPQRLDGAELGLRLVVLLLV